jgi:phosphoglycerate dehydrogenase-like enzyme
MSKKTISRRHFIASAGVVTAGVGLGAVPKQDVENGTGRIGPRLPMKIVTRGGLPPEYLTRIEAISPQIRFVQAANDEQWRQELADAHVVLGGVSPADFRLAKNLQWVQIQSAGVERALFPELINSGVIMTNAQGCYAPAIAEHVFGLLFGLTRGIAYQARQMREHEWKRVAAPIEMREMTIGIVGLGGIGRETARRAKAMDMRVIAVDAEPMYKERFAIVDEVHLVDDWLPTLLKTSDVVVSAAPHTKRTQGMFGEKEFGLMKQTAYFINVSRGKLVQTPALVKALKEKKLAGAGLDVTDPEPLPSDHALWDLPNVIITPHTAGQSQFSAGKRQPEVFIENVRRFAAGLPLLNVVDKVKGY